MARQLGYFHVRLYSHFTSHLLIHKALCTHITTQRGLSLGTSLTMDLNTVDPLVLMSYLGILDEFGLGASFDTSFGGGLKEPENELEVNYSAMVEEFGRLSINDEKCPSNNNDELCHHGDNDEPYRYNDSDKLCYHDGINLFRHLDAEAFTALFSRSRNYTPLPFDTLFSPSNNPKGLSDTPPTSRFQDFSHLPFEVRHPIWKIYIDWARSEIKNKTTSRIYTLRWITEKTEGGGHVLTPYIEPPQNWGTVRKPLGFLGVCRDARLIATHPETGVFATGELVKVPVYGWRDYLVVRPNVDHFSYYSCRGPDDEVLLNINRGITTEDMFREVYHRLRRGSPAYDKEVDRLLDTMKLPGNTFSRLLMLACVHDHRPFPQLTNRLESTDLQGDRMCIGAFWLCHEAMVRVEDRIDCRRPPGQMYRYSESLNGQVHPDPAYRCRCRVYHGPFRYGPWQCRCLAGDTRGPCVRTTAWERRHADKPWLSSPECLLPKEWV